MDVSDCFWFLAVMAAYLGELAEAGIGLTESLTVGAVLDDLCRLAGVPVCIELESAVSNVAVLPRAPGRLAGVQLVPSSV